MRCQVDTYSGSRLHERPRRFTWGEEWLEVRQVLAHWYTPDHLCFQVRAGDGRVYSLTYHSREEAWDVVLAGSEARKR
jgi:hypothetical protein